MPKGYNADGSKKQRPANSGRKPKAGKKIHSKLALDVLQILASQQHPIQFLENAVREKAARSTGIVLVQPLLASSNDKQLDLMDLLADIKAEQVATA